MTSKRAVLDVGRMLQLLGPIVGLGFVVLIFSGTRGFLTPLNVSIVLTQTVIVALGAIGMTMIIVGGGIDLSVGSIVALTGVVAAVAIESNWPTALVIMAAIAAGGACGFMNGAIIACFGMTPFIVTLGMMGVARGLAKWLGQNQTVNYSPGHAINRLMNNPLEINGMEVPLWMPPLGVLVALLAAGVMSVILVRTVFGRRIYALGSNEATARLCGIRTTRLKVVLYTVAGFFYGLAGLMQLSRLQQGDPTIAIGLELDVIAAVVIGGASLAGGSGSIPGAMIGALTMAVLRNGSDQMGWESYIQEIIIGAVIILAVGLDKLRRRTS